MMQGSFEISIELFLRFFFVSKCRGLEIEESEELKLALNVLRLNSFIWTSIDIGASSSFSSDCI
jgi:hypothetical protein